MRQNIYVKPLTSVNNQTGDWRVFKPKFIHDKCVSCGLCSFICPEGCIAMKNLKQYKTPKPITDYKYCKGCGLCAEECVVKAIIMELDKK
ncbi:MAG: 4Fe-4S binding protein [Patescibacteria group bacterium]